MYETSTGKNALAVQANFMAKFEAIRHRDTAENVMDQVGGAKISGRRARAVRAASITVWAR